MLYKLGETNGVFDSLEPMSFKSVALEKHLEDLLAKSLLDLLFEGNELMPIFQERLRQEEADIYALNKQGDLIIFELKRDGAGSDAVHQALRYCEKSAHWKYDRLQNMLSTYTKGKSVNLQEEHRLNFDLDHHLEKSAFNNQQRLIVVGNASSENLIRNVDYWKSKGILIDFIPYRIYELKNGDKKEHYFEFYSIPYDQHSNPAHIKGVIFDTNLSYDADGIWYMCENSRVAAFGDQMEIVKYLKKNDIVFLYHKNQGIIAAGKVTSNKVTEDEGEEALYHGLEWMTAKPTRGVPYKFMPASKIKKVLDRNFFWARTIKTPYLSSSESETLLKALIKVVGSKP